MKSAIPSVLFLVATYTINGGAATKVVSPGGSASGNRHATLDVRGMAAGVYGAVVRSAGTTAVAPLYLTAYRRN